MNYHDPSPSRTLDAALSAARENFHVFPIEPNGKRPLIENWQTAGTTDETMIHEWWTRWPNANIGCAPAKSGCFVIDLDQKGGKDGLAELKALEDANDELPASLIAATPSGGFHLWFKGHAPTSAGRLARGIDVRGGDEDGTGLGYVLLPGSSIDGKPYSAHMREPIAPAPDWLLAAAAKPKHAPAAAPDDLEIDAPANIARGAAFLKDHAPAIEGQGGDAYTYATAATLRDLGLSEDKAFELMAGDWNALCLPPWQPDELRAKVRNAFSYAQNEAGAYAVPGSALEVFGADVIERAIAATGTDIAIRPEKRSRFYPVGEDEMDRAATTRWLVSELIQEATMVLLVGETQSYKSFLALDIALAVATGRKTFGVTPNATGPTFYAALEGRHSIMGDRRKAWRIARGIEGQIDNFYVMPAPVVANHSECVEFVEQIVKRCAAEKPKVIVLETVNRMMNGLNENDAGDAGNLIRFCDGLVQLFGCTVIAVHHKSDKPGASATRGSSAFNAGFDTVIEVSAHRPTKAAEVRVRKHKDAAEREAPWTFKGRLVGPSLVFDPTTQAEHIEATKGSDPFAPKNVGAALRELGAIDRENGVTTIVLAQQLIPPLENESDEDRRSALRSAQQRLSAQSNMKAGAKTLIAYALKGAAPDGKGMLWCLPATPAE